MNEMKEFLRQNMPCSYQVRFTLVRRPQRAVIAGEIVMCDGVGDMLEKSDMLYLTPKELYKAAEEMNILRPSREEFSSALEMILGQRERR